MIALAYDYGCVIDRAISAADLGMKPLPDPNAVLGGVKELQVELEIEPIETIHLREEKEEVDPKFGSRFETLSIGS